jgi:hypothetical protein
MKNNYLVTQQIECDPKDLPSTDVKLVSFKTEVLDKYKTDTIKYSIRLDDGVGILSKKNGWQLQVDVQENCVNTFLYKLADLPDEEQQHFAHHNILPQYLSGTAYRRWIQGRP